MRKLTKSIMSAALVATAALGVTGTASAHSYGGDRYHAGQHGTPARADAIRGQLDQLQNRINRSDRRDHVSEREATGLRRDLWSVRDQFRRFNRDGLNRREFSILQNRIDSLRMRLHMERSDWNDHRG